MEGHWVGEDLSPESEEIVRFIIESNVIPCTYLEITEPYFVVKDGKCQNVVDEGLRSSSTGRNSKNLSKLFSLRLKVKFHCSHV